MVSMKRVRSTPSNQKQEIIYEPERKKEQLSGAALIMCLHVVQYMN